jgi:hypothetical protein
MREALGCAAPQLAANRNCFVCASAAMTPASIGRAISISAPGGALARL